MTHEFAYVSASVRGGSPEVGASLAPYGLVRNPQGKEET